MWRAGGAGQLAVARHDRARFGGRRAGGDLTASATPATPNSRRMSRPRTKRLAATPDRADLRADVGPVDGARAAGRVGP